MDKLNFINDAHRKLVSLKQGLIAISSDPYYAIDHFAEMGIVEAPTYIIDEVMEHFCQTLDSIKEFEKFDILVSQKGILKVCTKESHEWLATIDLQSKRYSVGKLTTNRPPDGLVDELANRRTVLKEAIAESKESTLVQKLKAFIFGDKSKDYAEELEVLNALDNSAKKEYVEWATEVNRIKAELAEVTQVIVPMLEEHGYYEA